MLCDSFPHGWLVSEMNSMFMVKHSKQHDAIKNTNATFKWGTDSGEEFIERYRGLTNALLANDQICGFCYTQLYDVEQEKNGLYTYRRTPKFDMEIFKAINTAKAAIED